MRKGTMCFNAHIICFTLLSWHILELVLLSKNQHLNSTSFLGQFYGTLWISEGT